MPRPTSTRWLAVLAVLALAAAPTVGTVAAQEDDAAGTLSTELDRQEGYEFEVDATGETLSGDFDLGNAQLNLTYAADRAEDRSPRGVNASIQVLGVYEYRDRNGNDRFDLGDDVVSFHGAEASQFARVERVQDGSSLEAFEASYPLEGGGELFYNVHVAAQPTSVEPGREVGPRSLALDVALEDVTTTAQDSQLALAMRVDSLDVDQTGPEKITVRGQGADFVYAWRSYATIDGLRTPVQSGVLEQHVETDGEERTEAVVVKTLQPGDRIEHEESVTVQHTEPAVQQVISKITGDPMLFSLGLLGAVLVVGGNAWRKLQREGPQGNA